MANEIQRRRALALVRQFAVRYLFLEGSFWLGLGILRVSSR